MTLRTAVRTLLASATLGLVAVVSASPAFAAPPAASESTGRAPADVDDFSYSSWESEYTLSLDAEGHAQATVVETLVADFPEFDQNRGLVRGIPLRFEHATLNVDVESVTDAAGNRTPYELDEDSGELLVLTGNDEFVRGPQTYVITYTMQNVIIATTRGVDEFYWNILPLDSKQPIDSFRGTVTLEPELADAYADAAVCYEGLYGSTARCDVNVDAPAVDESRTFTITAQNLAAGEGRTIAIRFDPGTATQPPSRQPDPLLDAVPAGLGVASLGTIAGGIFALRAQAARKRKPEGIVVAQYDVPDTLHPLLAAELLHRPKRALPAGIVNLAVIGALKIQEDKSLKRLRLHRRTPPASMQPLDERLLGTLFGTENPRESMVLPKTSRKFVTALNALRTAVTKDAVTQGLIEPVRSRAAIALSVAGMAIGLSTLVLGCIGAVQGRTLAPFWLLFGVLASMSGIFALIFLSQPRMLATAAAAEQIAYLAGVEEFIRVAEADRLRMLQSYTGAERLADGGVNTIVLYERLLPYAMLFGLEKEWTAVLTPLYLESQVHPGWYKGSSVGMMYTHLSTLSSATNSSLAAGIWGGSSGGGSSGGSFGGGFSGGGGGGGSSGGR